jgi:hypothetical protein
MQGKLGLIGKTYKVQLTGTFAEIQVAIFMRTREPLCGCNHAEMVLCAQLSRQEAEFGGSHADLYVLSLDR